MNTVDIIILNWNGREHLEVCLGALAEQEEPGPAWRVIVIDNGSTDGSVPWLEQQWPRSRTLGRNGRGHVELMVAQRNLGFCGGNNWAIERSSADGIVLLNNDTAPAASWLAELVEALASAPDDVACVSGKLVDWSGRRIDFVEGVMTFDGHAFQRGYRKPIAEVIAPAAGAEIAFPCGGNMIIRRRSFLEAGGFDPSYFAYLEDVDLGWRLWSGGERVTFSPGALARHRSMASSDQLGQERRGFLFERNAFLTAFKNYDDELWPRMMPAILWTFLARTRTLLAKNNRGGGLLTLDPYAQSEGERVIADSESKRVLHARGHEGRPPFVAAQPTLWQKWRGWGTRELARRGVLKLRRRLAAWIEPNAGSPTGAQGSAAVVSELLTGSGFEGVLLDDARSLAQLQAAHDLLDRCAASTQSRVAIQARRRRNDRDYLSQFPPYLVPTYPGDEELFADPGFLAMLPDDVPLIRSTLEELMDH